jgi:hypothetical protein
MVRLLKHRFPKSLQTTYFLKPTVMDISREALKVSWDIAAFGIFSITMEMGI